MQKKKKICLGRDLNFYREKKKKKHFSKISREVFVALQKGNHHLISFYSSSLLIGVCPWSAKCKFLN